MPQQGCHRLSHRCLSDGAELPLHMSLTLARHAAQQLQLLTYLGLNLNHTIETGVSQLLSHDDLCQN